MPLYISFLHTFPCLCVDPQVYRVMDNVTYSVVLEEYDAEKGGWTPYIADDVQVK